MIPHILLCTKPPAADCRGLFYEILSLSFILGFLHHIIQRGYPCAGSAFGLKGKGRRITPGRACDIQVYPWFSFAEFPDEQSRRNGTAAVGAHIFHICHITFYHLPVFPSKWETKIFFSGMDKPFFEQFIKMVVIGHRAGNRIAQSAPYRTG